MSINFNVLRKNPLLFVISGPTAVGKDSVIHALHERQLPLHFVVTANTRPPRPDEVEGVDYFFVSHEKFEEMIHNQELIEYSHVYNDYKGVPRSQVEDAFKSGKDVIMRLDVQGAEKIRKIYPQAVLIFLVPGSEEEWMERLNIRSKERTIDLSMRIEKARQEMDKLPIFDYVVVNHQDHLQEAVNTVVAIMTAEHSRVHPRKLIP